ncbi:DEAD/DEAH box helicase [Alkalicoccus halolimnae]|uniref:DEAD/DEAH box helicase n=1 Tax=Alkalicoccus halolimnae TaxID=1667239 RepID=A0A5C7F9X7_9BACI|nr:DEAD/DEAH box helicase [Alkalicoccus halolimnae]TXF86208.1 DEAD/DEAH box helicase [Alkalicoccus halolimnae]
MSENEFEKELEEIIIEYKSDFSSKKLPHQIAKLYSHFTKVNLNQYGLRSWGKADFQNSLEEAFRLIHIGFNLKDIAGGDWELFFLKAGEILEWLSHPKVNTYDYPLHFLSAAAYQIAGYPALANGLLNERKVTSKESEILRMFLKNDFKNLVPKLESYWTNNEFKNKKNERETFEDDINDYIVREVISVIGVLVTYFKWGDTDRIEKAIKKFESLSKLMLYDTNSFNWIFSKLCSELTKGYIKNSIRKNLNDLREFNNESLDNALEGYIKKNFLENKSLLWPSQIKGLNKLINSDSFVICTPTGSGKTTVAELSIIKNLFKEIDYDSANSDFFSNTTRIRALFSKQQPVILYLVPSRALAAETEAKLSRVLQNIMNDEIVVTGLYGGIDWGPTDAWINQNLKTVLICTYEKGEALLRFLGPLFMSRLSLVVIDEAHSVQFDQNTDSLISGDNRSLRLESLGSRLVNRLHSNNNKVIALSAVIGDKSKELSNWITNNKAEAVETPYRSTRQLIGRLEFYKSGDFSIKYDLLNGDILRFEEKNETEDSPFIPHPFPSSPKKFVDLPKSYIGANKGFPKYSRPYLFWAAIQLAKTKQYEKQSTVLVSVMQHVNGYADDFNHVLTKVYSDEDIPNFFEEPTHGNNKILWERCLESCLDYYGENSNEYKLLKRGIVVHYGKMPGLLSRLLIEVINKKIVHIVLASSTLSEGVNLPFDIVLIPVLSRRGDPISVNEFKNLVGRAGRPGNGTEGRSLILLESSSKSIDYSSNNARSHYGDIIRNYLNVNEKFFEEEIINPSPIANLISFIRREWAVLTGSNSEEEFYQWLEECVPSENEDIFEDKFELNVEKGLDTLDGIILSSIVEIESIEKSNLSKSNYEVMLKNIWKKTFAFFTSEQEEKLESVFLKRGNSLVNDIYPDQEHRRKIYKTSLQPRYASQLFRLHQQIIDRLKEGEEYKNWTTVQKVNFIISCVREIIKLEKFAIKEGVGKGASFVPWEDILHWWLTNDSKSKPKTKQIPEWIKFVYDNFNYKFNWGIGTVLSLVWDEVNNGELNFLSLDDWENTELPWIVFWIKELITWGTYDPVIAYLLSSGYASTREEAKEYSEKYYLYCDFEDDIYNVKLIRKWIKDEFPEQTNDEVAEDALSINANSVRQLKNKTLDWNVFPVIQDSKVLWVDYSGYLLAESNTENMNVSSITYNRDYIFNADISKVSSRKYFKN